MSVSLWEYSWQFSYFFISLFRSTSQCKLSSLLDMGLTPNWGGVHTNWRHVHLLAVYTWEKMSQCIKKLLFSKCQNIGDCTHCSRSSILRILSRESQFSAIAHCGISRQKCFPVCSTFQIQQENILIFEEGRWWNVWPMSITRLIRTKRIVR